MLARAARTLPVRAERVFLHLPPRAPPSAHTRPHPTAPLPFQLGSTTQSRAASSLASTDFMHNSFIPTMHYQASLPRLPVPALDGTLDRYLYNVEAVITPDELAHTKAAVEDFRRGAGPKLQEQLVMFDREHRDTSYISKMWYDMYLENRDPFPLNLTPQLTWCQHENPAHNEPCTRAADIIVSAVRFHRSLEAGVLNPDVFSLNPKTYDNPWLKRGISLLPEAVSFYAAYAVDSYPLDMSQYARLFSSTRVPQQGKDKLVTHTGSRHIVVMRGSKLYKLPVMDDHFQPYSAGRIESALRGIMADSAGSQDGPAVGALTGAERNSWARTRATMETSPVNAASLAEVDSALFVLTMDDARPESHEAIAETMLYGPATNRWFDKCFNIIVCQNGRAGIAWEHAWGDGVAVLNFFNEVFKEISATPSRAQAGPDSTTWSELSWDLSLPSVRQDIADATEYSRKVISEVDLDVYQTESMTKKHVKDSNHSPDGLMQMVLQRAHWKLFNEMPVTYESASTAAFKHGRTEVIRSATPEAKAMCEAFSDPNATPEAKARALRVATSNHFRITRDALIGKGVDRHLFALKHFAARAGALPDIFTDPTYDKMGHIRLSTSTLASPALDGGGFGPVNKDCFAVGYGTADRGMQFSIMSYGLGNSDFANAVEGALQEFREVMHLDEQ